MKANGEYKKSLEELSKDRTTITIAHRLSTIKNADEIIVITEDGIAERGTHGSLLDKTDFTLTITALDLFTFPDYKNKCMLPKTDCIHLFFHLLFISYHFPF